MHHATAVITLFTFLVLSASSSPAPADDAALPAVGSDLAALRDAFSAADGKARVIAITSVRSPAAKNAMRAIRAEVLTRITSPDLVVFAVWVPEKSGDPESKAVREADRLEEPRLKPFWAEDPDSLDLWRATLVASHAELETDDLPRSRLYAVYPPDARWAEAPPTPAYWSHIDKKLMKEQPALDIDSLRIAIEQNLEPEPEDVSDVRTESRTARGNPNQVYFLHGPIGSTRVPEPGHPLLVVLPGGSGSAEFRAFVKRIGKNGAGDGWLVAQLVSKMWTEEQRIIWPTGKNPARGQKFSTEEFIESVIEDVRKSRRVDPGRIVLLGWSSSGPALYAHALRENDPSGVRRYFISQSVFKPHLLPDLSRAKGKRIHLHHSPTDQRCRFTDAQRAERDLGTAGAAVQLVEYVGGHGWHGNVFGQIRAGLLWLERE